MPQPTPIAVVSRLIIARCAPGGSDAGEVPVDDARPRPGQDAHEHHDHDRHRNGVFLEGADGVEAVDADRHLQRHHDRDDDEVGEPRVGNAELAEDRHSNLDREIRVDADPAKRHQEHQRARQISAAPSEGRAAKHHLIDAGLVTHDGEGGENRAADEVADHDDGNGVPQSELQDDAEGAERPVERCDIRAGPDPHLLRAGGVPVTIRDRLDAVIVRSKF